jgi:L-fuconolactonase
MSEHSDDNGIDEIQVSNRVIDAHVHFWQYNKQRDSWMDNMKLLQKDYLPGTLSSTLKNNGVDGCVAVQASQQELETHFLVELAKTHSFINGVVGWVDLQKHDIEQRVEYFSQYPVIKGWRHIVQAEPDGFLGRTNFKRGVKTLERYNYSYDILIYSQQLKPALEFVAAFPGMKLVIDHCAKPDIARKKIDDWKVLIEEIAKNPNVCCKLSGLLTEAKWKEWSPVDFYPCLDVVFGAFGTDRLLFGSDWPVLLVSGMYVQWKSLLEKYMEGFTPEERANVFGGNAIRFYNLK